MDNITNTILSLAAFITAIATLIVNIIKAKKEIENTLPKKIQKQSNIDIEITNRLENIKEYLKADRVQVYDFHNRSDTMQMAEVL